MVFFVMHSPQGMYPRPGLPVRPDYTRRASSHAHCCVAWGSQQRRGLSALYAWSLLGGRVHWSRELQLLHFRCRSSREWPWWKEGPLGMDTERPLAGLLVWDRCHLQPATLCRGNVRQKSSRRMWRRHARPLYLASGDTLTGKNRKEISGNGRKLDNERGEAQIEEEEAESNEHEDSYDSEEDLEEDEDEIRGFFDEEETTTLPLQVDDNILDFEDGRPDPGGRSSSNTTVGISGHTSSPLSSRVDELCTRVQAADGFTVSTSDISALYEFPIDKFQRLAIEGFLKGSSLVVCAPTSSGKTLIAEAAAAATLARRKRLFYTTPLKALSNQKLREFRKFFGESNVGLLTGDAAVNREAPIMVMTTEILRNMLYQSDISSGEGSGRLENVTTVVLDEVHYLSDISRGTVWEETVIYCPKDVQLICLSATVANPEELAGWIAQVHGSTELVTGNRRPVPLTWHFSTRYELLPLLNEHGTGMNWKLSTNSLERGYPSDDPSDDVVDQGEGRRRGQFRKRLNGNSPSSSSSSRSRANESNSGRRRRARGGGRNSDSRDWEAEIEEAAMSEETLQFIRRRRVPQIRDTLGQLMARDMLPAIWFIFSRRGCDTAVRYLEEAELLSEKEAAEVTEAVMKFERDHPDAVRQSAVGALGRGVAAHHAGCLPTWKSFIEELFQRGLIKVVFATETLAAGINMPARTTVLSSISKRGDAGHNFLSTNAMLQMAGRAGRRGIDEQGHVVMVQTPFEGPEDGCNILFSGVDPLVSQFTATYGMALNLLAGGKVTDARTFSALATNSTAEFHHLPTVPFGRTLDDARKLIEQSFGNYVGSEVIHVARKQVAKLEDEVERLVQKAHAESGPQVLETRLTKAELQEYLDLKDLVKERKAALQRTVSDMEAPPASSFGELYQDDASKILSSPASSFELAAATAAASATETLFAEQRKEISVLRKKLKKTRGYREKHQLVVLQKSRLEKIARLTDKANRITDRIKQMAPSGWNEFLQLVEILNAVEAVNMERGELLPLGQMASAIRGENELWLALVFSNESVLSLTSAQLAAVCGSLVSEGLKARPDGGRDGAGGLYEASRPVLEWMMMMENVADWLQLLQAEHGVQIPCHLDSQFAGMVEAWAAGVTWKELTADCGMDEGDVARLLRRSIDLLAQIPHMPHIAPDIAKLATQTTKVMDRPPISELVA